MSCQVKLGLFVLRECGETPKSLCKNCNLAICSKHTKESTGGAMCPECYIQLYPENPDTQEYKQYLSGQRMDYNQSYYFLMRNDFQKKNIYGPFSDTNYREFNSETINPEFRDDKFPPKSSLDS